MPILLPQCTAVTNPSARGCCGPNGRVPGVSRRQAWTRMEDGRLKSKNRYNYQAVIRIDVDRHGREQVPFHGGNTGSNPVGDARQIKGLALGRCCRHRIVRKKYGIGVAAEGCISAPQRHERRPLPDGARSNNRYRSAAKISTHPLGPAARRF